MIQHAASVALGLANLLDAEGGKLTFRRMRQETAALDAARRAEVFRALPERRQDEAWEELAKEQAKRTEADWLEAQDRVDTEKYREHIVTIGRDAPPAKVRPFARSVSGTDHLLDIPSSTYVAVLSGEEPGRGGVMACPLPDHEDRTPSFRVYGDGWYCHGCGRGGSIIDLAAGLWGIEPRGAGYHEIRRRLAGRFGMRAA